MAIAFPRALPDALPIVGVTFMPKPTLELTPYRRGRRVAMDLGPTPWWARWRSDRADPAEAGIIRAWYDTLLSTQTFYGFDKLREYPLAYRNGWGNLTFGGNPFNGNGRLTSVAGNKVEVGIDQLPIGFQISPGDYCCWDYNGGVNRALHRFSAAAVANGAGVLSVELRPYVLPGWAAGATVSFYRPSARMIIIPESWEEQFSPPHWTAFSFEAIQNLP